MVRTESFGRCQRLQFQDTADVESLRWLFFTHTHTYLDFLILSQCFLTVDNRLKHHIHKSQYEDAITVNSELKSAYDAAADDDA